ncbi:hypothetical protein [Paenibacillus arenilitoris]|uniref:hypothetical protein n=1 Tax=Paenibacillus arenilitoris TaxID=2772299 RepID=UPI0021E0D0EC|nr:hypothetical protein [Paenibacillus arenilitoris]
MANAPGKKRTDSASRVVKASPEPVYRSSSRMNELRSQSNSNPTTPILRER